MEESKATSEALTKRKRAAYNLDFEKYNSSQQPLTDFGPRIAENIAKFDSSYYRYDELSIQETLVQYLAALAVLVVIVAIVGYCTHYDLPKAIPSDSSKTLFSEERARIPATYLSETIGNRLVGSKANDLAEDYVLSQVQKIKEHVDAERARGKTNVPTIEIDVQRASGVHVFHFIDAVLTLVYTNITNIVVRISDGTDKGKKDAILVNSHFDSTLTSPGAADDAVAVGVMIEILNVLSHMDPMNHAVIFLFNGAEESLQEGSHAFITQHPWADTCRVVVNMEACGSGGPEIVFQAGSPLALRAFAKAAPQPFGSSFGNDIFESGIIISDTDYRIFAEYKGVKGLDMAYYKNSYVYHTTLDRMDIIEEGSVQHLGDNALAVIRQMANFKELISEDSSTMVYFDFLGTEFRSYSSSLEGLIMITYSQFTAKILHFGFVVIIFIAALFNDLFTKVKSAHEQSITPIFMALWSTVLSLLAGVAASASFGILLSVLNPMIWYRFEPLAILMFGFPAITGILASQWWFYESKGRFKKVKRMKTRLEWFSLVGVSFFFCLAVVIATGVGLGGSYYFFVWTVSLVGMMLFNFYFSTSENQQLLSFTYILGFFFPGILSAEILWAVVEVFVPLTERIGHFVWSDLLISVIIGSFVSLVGLFLIPFSHRAGNLLTAVKTMAFLTLISLLLVMVIFRTPFDKQHPKRVFWQHANVLLPNQKDKAKMDKSFIMLGGADAISILTLKPLIDKANTKNIRNHHNLEEWDPVFPFSHMLVADTVQFPVPPNQNIRPPYLDIISDTYDQATNLRTLKLNFVFAGNEWSTLRFREDLESWSLTPVLPPVSDNRYILRHVGRHGSSNLPLTLVLRGQKRINLFITASHYQTSPMMDGLVNFFPEWVTHMGLTSSMSSWEL